MDRVSLQRSEQLRLVSSSPRRIPKQHFVKDDAYRPDIAFRSVGCSLQDLRCHVNWTADTGFQHLGAKVIHVLGKTKIRNFIHAVIDQNICWLEISMDYLRLDELGEATQDLSDDIECLVLFEPSSLDDFLQVSIFTKLSNDVQAVERGEDILETHYVWMVELLE